MMPCRSGWQSDLGTPQPLHPCNPMYSIQFAQESVKRTMDPAIFTNNLSKQYGDVTAVDDLSLHVSRGEIYAFLGLNGAGKTTTIRMLLGMIKPTGGQATVLGERVSGGRNQPWNSVGYLVETANAYPDLTVRQNLEMMRRLRPGVAPSAIDRAIEVLGLTQYGDRRAGKLSLGNAQRLGLAKALMHDPELLILDEPANGLDPAGIVEIRNLLAELAHDQGVTVFMSSHILGEVSRLADRIGIIHEGRLLQEMNVDELERNRRRQLLVQTRDMDSTRHLLNDAGFALSVSSNGVFKLESGHAVERPDDIAKMLVEAGHAPTLISVEQEDLEHYFLRLVRREVTT